MLDEPSLYRAIFGAYPDALLLVDSLGKIVLTNPAADTLFGYQAGELIDQNVDILVPDSIRARHAQYREGYGRNPHTRPMGTQMDLVGKRRDGSEVMVEIALSPLHGRQLPYVVVSVRGIGAYPRVKQALQRARYSEFVAKMGRLAVDTRDPQVLLQQVPAVAAEALEVQTAVLYLLQPNRLEFKVEAGVNLLPGESIGAHVPNRPDVPPGMVLAAGRPMSTDDYSKESHFSVPRQYIDAGLNSALAVPLFDRGEAIGVLTVRAREAKRFGDDEVHFLESLSNLLAATLQRLQTEETLNHAQRLETVGQLTGGIAHDFNNLLTVIQGNLQVLEEQPLIGEASLQLVASAMRASRRAAELTGKLLAFSRRQVLTPSHVDVPVLLRSLADMLRRTLDQRIRIDVDAQPGCPACLADSGQLESALLNVAVNARDAMPSGGSLSFACRYTTTLPLGLHHDFLADAQALNGYVAIAIADSGTGMPEEIKERAFEPFFTTKDTGRGTGLGLSTVYGFARQSKGAVTLESQPGAGTTVTLYIPAVAVASHGDDEAGPAVKVLPPGLRVLLVEDEPEVRAIAAKFLEALHCVTTTVDNAEQALQTLSCGAPFDLLLSDVALGTGMRGTELAREVNAQHPHMAVLLVSGYSAELLELNDSAPSTWELLAKPYTRNDLQQGMAQALFSQRQASY